MQKQSQLDFNQKIPILNIVTQDQTFSQQNKTFHQSLQIAQQIARKMKQSKFYKNITIHIGSQTHTNSSLYQQLYTPQLNNLKYRLDEQKDYLNKIISAKNQQQLKIRQLQHSKNILYILQEQQKTNLDFLPVIFIQAQKKGPIYGHCSQQFSKRGVGNFTAKIGIRAPFKQFDYLQFRLQSPMSKIINKYKYYQTNIQWNMPFNKQKIFKIGIGANHQMQFQNIDVSSKSCNIGIVQNKNSYQLLLGVRTPYIHQDINNLIKNNYYKPSTKISFKHSHTFSNNIQFGQVAEGLYHQIKTQTTIPKLSQSSFFKIQYNLRKMFDTYPYRKYFQSDIARKFFWKSSLQTNFSMSSIIQYGSKKYINDVLDVMEIRGFQSFRKPCPSYVNFKASGKFNLHNFPLLKDANIVAFGYTQVGLSFLKNYSFKKPYFLGSTGLGISFYASPLAQIQILCNLAEYQNKPLRQTTNFQIRFGVFD